MNLNRAHLLDRRGTFSVGPSALRTFLEAPAPPLRFQPPPGLEKGLLRAPVSVIGADCAASSPPGACCDEDATASVSAAHALDARYF